MDKKAYRNTLGQFATGVAIVTALGPNKKPAGRTINSFVSISLEPRLVGWCLDINSQAREVFDSCNGFAVNVLSCQQEKMAYEQAKRGEFELKNGEIKTSNEGIPLLANALASLICETHDQIKIGDHILYVGRVTEYKCKPVPVSDPLIFFRGKFGLKRVQKSLA